MRPVQLQCLRSFEIVYKDSERGDMTSTKVVNATSAAPPSVGKEPRTRRKPRRRRRMLTGVSRQRRAANARERQRIQGVNDAFLSLRAILPVLKPEDVSKTETLRLAAKWIAHLTTLLIQDDRKRKWSPENSAGKCLPVSIQEKLNELLSFDLEDFMLVQCDPMEDTLTSNSNNKTGQIEYSDENHRFPGHSEDGSLTGSDGPDSDNADSSEDGSDPLLQAGRVSAGCSPGLPYPGGEAPHRGGLNLPHDLLLDLTNLSPGPPSTYQGYPTGVRCNPLTPIACHTGISNSYQTLPPVSTFYR